ncbi:fumarylacetoacetate hydrolase family protein, partial [Dickeya lacustris]
MKLASYRHQGNNSYGIYTSAGLIDLGRRLGERYPDLKALLAADALDVAAAFQGETPDVAVADVTFLPVIVSPSKILCVGMNYADKRKEFNELNPAPTLFVRFPDSQT